MPMLGLFNYRKFLFQRLKMLIARIFQVVKPFRFTNVGRVRNFYSSCFSKFCKDAKSFKLFVDF